MDILNRFKDKKILIWGYGREGKSTEEFFKKHPVAAAVEISEEKPDQIDLSGYDYVFKSPGIRLEHAVLEQFADGELDKLTSQTALFIEAFRDRVIGITGTKGKSTTTSLLHHVLKTCFESGVSGQDGSLDVKKGPRTAYLVGNIGLPCLDRFDEMANSDDIAVFELSCHQLAYTGVSPHISIFLNLYEDHLDFYGDRATYFRAKRHIAEFHKDCDFLYIGTDVPDLCDPMLQKVSGEAPTTMPKSHIIRVTDRYEDDAMNLLGEHNRYNASFVNHVATERFGLDKTAVKKAIEEFPGLPHRLQYIGTVDGVRFYDDSISTIPEATIQAVESVPGCATVLVGGMDREIDYTPLIHFIPEHPEVKFICMYASGKRVYDEVVEFAAKSDHLTSKENLIYVPDLAAAVTKAKQVTESGSACVLSPAAASYGYFRNFEERGDRFSELVKSM